MPLRRIGKRLLLQTALRLRHALIGLALGHVGSALALGRELAAATAEGLLRLALQLLGLALRLLRAVAHRVSFRRRPSALFCKQETGVFKLRNGAAAEASAASGHG